MHQQETPDALRLVSPTGVTLEISSPRRPYNAEVVWTVRLAAPELDAAVVFEDGGWRSVALAEFFAGVDRDWKGWSGERHWQSSEYELELTARHNGVGVVTLAVEITDGAPARWTAKADLELDPGAFGGYARDLRSLLTAAPKP